MSSPKTDKKTGQFGEWFSALLADNDEAPKTFRLFERKVQDGQYYTAHGNDALWVADEFFKTREVLKYLGNEDEKLAGVTIRSQKAVTIVKHILLEKLSDFERVEVYARPEERAEYSLQKKATAGNLKDFDDWLFDGEGSTAMKESSNVMALKLTCTGNERVVGVAFVDATLRKMDVCEFIDNDRFTNLESVILQRGAKECVLGLANDATVDAKKIRNLMEKLGLPIQEKKPAEFKAADIEQDLGRLVGPMEQHLNTLEKKSAMAALSCLIKHLELLGDESGGSYKLNLFDLSQYMKFDKAAMEALNLFPQASDSDKNMSLYGLLNKGRTSSGARLLMQWVKQPLLELKAIERRLDFVELFMEDGTLRQALQEQHLRRVPDLDRMAKKFQKKKANLQTVVDFYKFCVCLPGMMSGLKDHEGPHKQKLEKEFIRLIEELQQDLGQFEAMVEHTIDLDAVDKHEFLVNPSFDPKLEDLRNQKDDIYEQMKDLLKETATDLGLDDKKVKLNHADTLGDHFRISRKDERVLRKKTATYINLETRKDGVRFTSKRMKSLSQEHASLKQQYEEVQAAIVEKALEITESYTPVMEKLNEVLAELDVLVGLAHVSVNAPTPYVRPEILPMGSGKLKLVASRHPCVEMMDSVEFISNDLVLERGSSNVQIITGPNMGGKSTYIRQAGVVCLMAQIGCFVPCESATVSIVDCILARVGAGDSQLKGVSTFMKEMLEASAILNTATGNSLIIIDELGRGTSTYDGFGLAWAISEHIAKQINAFAVFATHFHELTALANIQSNVVNKHVTAHTDEKSITMLYKVLDGPCDRSFGIHVSELANFPPEVVQMAKRKAAELEDFGSTAGMDLLTLAQDGESDSNKRVKLGATGSKRVSPGDEDAFVQDFVKLPIQDMSDDQVREALKKFRGEHSSFFTTVTA